VTNFPLHGVQYNGQLLKTFMEFVKFWSRFCPLYAESPSIPFSGRFRHSLLFILQLFGIMFNTNLLALTSALLRLLAFLSLHYLWFLPNEPPHPEKGKMPSVGRYGAPHSAFFLHLILRPLNWPQ
jgi:hypothetical protein